MQLVEKMTISVREAIETRHSIRQYQDESISRDEIEALLRMVRLAPSAWNVQPWRFHVVTDPDVKQQLRKAAYDQPQVTRAPVVIMVVSDMEDVMEHTEEIAHPGMSDEAQQRLVKTIHDTFGNQSVEQRGQWALNQTNIALGFLLVAARGMGYATVPMLGFDHGQVRQILGLPDHVQFAAMVAMGHPAEEGFPHHRHPLYRIMTYH